MVCLTISGETMGNPKIHGWVTRTVKYHTKGPWQDVLPPSPVSGWFHGAVPNNLNYHKSGCLILINWETPWNIPTSIVMYHHVSQIANHTEISWAFTSIMTHGPPKLPLNIILNEMWNSKWGDHAETWLKTGGHQRMSKSQESQESQESSEVIWSLVILVKKMIRTWWYHTHKALDLGKTNPEASEELSIYPTETTKIQPTCC